MTGPGAEGAGEGRRGPHVQGLGAGGAGEGRRGSRGQGPTRLADLLASAGRKLGMDAPEESARVFASWGELVGEDVARHARPGSLKAGVLKVWVDSPSWATEMTYLGPQIVARAAEVVGNDAIREIRPYLGHPPQNLRAPVTRHPRGSEERADRADSESVPDDPMGALARARLAWEKRVLRARSKDRSTSRSDRQIPR
jgi:predicted nucleic acid-binding Zn ribbon protein